VRVAQGCNAKRAALGQMSAENLPQQGCCKTGIEKFLHQPLQGGKPFLAQTQGSPLRGQPWATRNNASGVSSSA